MDTRKRSRGELGANSNGGFKKARPEMDSLSSGIGSKSKPCTKFFSTAGCPFGENCHFLHFVPGGYNSVAQMMNLSPAPPSRTAPVPMSVQNGSASLGVKTKICNKFNTVEGCKFGDKCNFAHGEWEIGKPIVSFQQEDPRPTGPISGRYGARPEPPVPASAGGFGLTATAKISVDASLAGAIIGKGGVNSKQICRQTGVKLAIRDHESDPNVKNIELEGTFEQIQQASSLVRDLIASIGPANGPTSKAYGGSGGGSNFKTKLCENFSKGSCTFGDKCHFAHGAGELRKT